MTANLVGYESEDGAEAETGCASDEASVSGSVQKGPALGPRGPDGTSPDSRQSEPTADVDASADVYQAAWEQYRAALALSSLEDLGESIAEQPDDSSDEYRELVAKIDLLRKAKARGEHFNLKLSGNAKIYNPRWLEKLAEYADIENLFASNLPKSVYDPHSFSKEMFYDQIAKAQLAAEDRRTARQSKRSNIEFVSKS